jgi:hypothetical protein
VGVVLCVRMSKGDDSSGKINGTMEFIFPCEKDRGEFATDDESIVEEVGTVDDGVFLFEINALEIALSNIDSVGGEDLGVIDDCQRGEEDIERERSGVVRHGEGGGGGLH